MNSIQIRKTSHGWRIDQYRDEDLIYTSTVPRKLDVKISVKTCKRYFEVRNLQYTVEVATTNRKKNQ
jgi:hypothetical protein